MGIEALRDVVIIVSGLVVTLAAIFVAVITYLLYHRASIILKSATTVATRVEALTAIATEQIGKPLIRAAGIVGGLACGIRGINRIFRKGGEK